MLLAFWYSKLITIYFGPSSLYVLHIPYCLPCIISYVSISTTKVERQRLNNVKINRNYGTRKKRRKKSNVLKKFIVHCQITLNKIWKICAEFPSPTVDLSTPEFSTCVTLVILWFLLLLTNCQIITMICWKWKKV